MTYLGIDYGEKRIGLACGDAEVRLATPLDAAVEATETARLDHIEREATRRRVGALVVGYPLNMDGSIGFKAEEVDAFIARLQARLALPVHRIDERLSSQMADAATAAAAALPGGRRKRKTPQQQLAERRRGDRDSRAAAIILQDYLDALPDALGAASGHNG